MQRYAFTNYVIEDMAPVHHQLVSLTLFSDAFLYIFEVKVLYICTMGGNTKP